MARLALAHAAGAIPVHLGAPLPAAPLLLSALLLPVPLWRRPRAFTGLIAAALAGALSAGVHVRADASDCRRAIADGAQLAVTGRLPGPAADGRGGLVVEEGLGRGCTGEITLLLAPPAAPPPAGPLLTVRGRWRASPGAPTAQFAGVLRVDRWSPASSERIAPFARLRGAAATRLFAMFGERAPLASALVLSRTEGLDLELRDAFARSGIAHLLSISGFHVAVVAALLVALLRLLRVPSPAALAGATAGVWGYVLLIGAPDAGVRAALLFSVLICARWAGRPLSSEGSLAASFLLLALIDPGGPGRPGFQLSFAGAAGLTRFGPAIDEQIERYAPRLPRELRSGFAAGLGATAATIPVVAWHFERISLVGIPGTMVAGPLCAIAIPGVLLVLLVSSLSPALARFLAGGTDLVLLALIHVVKAFGEPAWASVAVSRGWVLAGAVGVGGAVLALHAATGVGRGVRRAALAVGALVAIELAPLAQTVADRGTVAIEMLDVGQGDAILVRSPAGRWLLIDAGPRSDRFDAGERVVLPALRRRGIRRLEALVLTHPHLDHIGGAGAVLRAMRVGAVIDPGQPQGSGALIDALEAAAGARTEWSVTQRGRRLALDGMTLEVLHPSGPPAGPEVDPNDVSVVLLLRYGAFAALLTGDAQQDAEDRLAADTGPVQVLKVAHHGSRTSTSEIFLERLHPALALLSVGRDNDYGHPAPEVVARLRASGARVLRTDRNGELDVRAKADGSWTAATARGPD